MTKLINIVACKIFEPELEVVFEQIKNEKLFDSEIKITYLQAGLHSDLNRLKQTILDTLDSHKDDKIILLYGRMCHPHFKEMLEGHDVSPFPEENCVRLIMPEVPVYEKGCIHITTGFMKHWRELGKNQFGELDEVNMRQAFGIYDTMILGDTGVAEITDEEIIDVFEVLGVPIETQNIELDYFKNRIIDSIKYAIETSS